MLLSTHVDQFTQYLSVVLSICGRGGVQVVDAVSICQQGQRGAPSTRLKVAAGVVGEQELMFNFSLLQNASAAFHGRTA